MARVHSTFLKGRRLTGHGDFHKFQCLDIHTVKVCNGEDSKMVDRLKGVNGNFLARQLFDRLNRGILLYQYACRLWVGATEKCARSNEGKIETLHIGLRERDHRSPA